MAVARRRGKASEFPLRRHDNGNKDRLALSIDNPEHVRPRREIRRLDLKDIVVAALVPTGERVAS